MIDFDRVIEEMKKIRSPFLEVWVVGRRTRKYTKRASINSSKLSSTWFGSPAAQI